jgi:hypothetical protein
MHRVMVPAPATAMAAQELSEEPAQVVVICLPLALHPQLHTDLVTEHADVSHGELTKEILAELGLEVFENIVNGHGVFLLGARVVWMGLEPPLGRQLLPFGAVHEDPAGPEGKEDRPAKAARSAPAGLGLAGGRPSGTKRGERGGPKGEGAVLASLECQSQAAGSSLRQSMAKRRQLEQQA